LRFASPNRDIWDEEQWAKRAQTDGARALDGLLAVDAGGHVGEFSLLKLLPECDQQCGGRKRVEVENVCVKVQSNAMGHGVMVLMTLVDRCPAHIRVSTADSCVVL